MLKSGKLANVIKEMRQAKLDVLGLTEVRWKDGGDFVNDGVRVIYAGGDDSQRGERCYLMEQRPNVLQAWNVTATDC